ncbi:YppG family protein [Bacillus alkalicellulosilyticus]|uniref:YppG family protein n=1 Tax=Alkalihalobacterium alkalicellulosilyticum TaxID=1912214 RepID=UPI0009977AD7|nr:YppG family protein [Bacillus alkalicellulosilyticus]
MFPNSPYAGSQPPYPYGHQHPYPGMPSPFYHGGYQPFPYGGGQQMAQPPFPSGNQPSQQPQQGQGQGQPQQGAQQQQTQNQQPGFPPGATGYPPYGPQPGGFNFLAAFTDETGKFNLTKTQKTVDDVVKTVNQVTPLMKQMGSIFGGPTNS